MTTLKHKVDLGVINSVDNIIKLLNTFPNTKCTIVDQTITSVELSIEIDEKCSLDAILSLGVLIGTIQTSSLI